MDLQDNFHNLLTFDINRSKTTQLQLVDFKQVFQWTNTLFE